MASRLRLGLSRSVVDFPQVDAYLAYYAKTKPAADSAWAGDQAPLAELMDSHCNDFPELMRPSPDRAARPEPRRRRGFGADRP